MFIESIQKEITIGTKTRKIMRLTNDALMAGVTVQNTDGKMDFPAVNIDHSEEVMLRLMTGLSQDEVDSLTEKEYDSVKLEISKKK